MSVNTVSVLNNKREKKKTSRPFSCLSFQFLPPPPPCPPPHSPYHHFPFSPIDPSSCIPPGCPETLHYCCHGNASIIWQWSRTLSPPTPSCLSALFSAAAPPSLLLSLKTWLPDKKKSPNHSSKWAIWWWDDPPRFFSSLPKPLKWLQQS